MLSVLIIGRTLTAVERAAASWRSQLGPGDEILLVPQRRTVARRGAAAAGPAVRRIGASQPVTRAIRGRHVLVVTPQARPADGAVARIRAVLVADPNLDCLRSPACGDIPGFPGGQRRLFGVPLRLVLPCGPMVVSRRFLAKYLSRREWRELLDGACDALWLAAERAGGGVWASEPLVRAGSPGERAEQRPVGLRRGRQLLERWSRLQGLDVEVRGAGRELELRARRPRGIDIELTNRCNAACSFCPRQSCRQTGDMDSETFDRLLEFAREQPIGTIYFIGRGEPMVHPQFMDFVARIKRRTGLHFEVFTNGLCLTPDRIDALAELNDPELDIAINVSLHSLREEIHRQLTGGSLRRIAANLRYLQTKSDRLRVSYAFVTNKVNEDEMARLRRYLDRTGNTDWDISLVYNKGGFVPEGSLFDEDFFRRHLRLEPEQPLPDCGPCWYSYCQRYYWLNYRGEFTLCHDDYLDETILGRLGEVSLEDIDARVARLSEEGGALRCRRCNKRLREMHHGANRDPASHVKDRFRPFGAGGAP